MKQNFTFLGNFIPTDDSLKGKAGSVYRMHSGFCLETQAFPDSVNQPNFPEDSILRPGQFCLSLWPELKWAQARALRLASNNELTLNMSATSIQCYDSFTDL